MGEITKLTQPEWTIMIYFAADNNLCKWGRDTLKDLQGVGSAPEVRVAAQFDGQGDRGIWQYRIRKGTADADVKLDEKQVPDSADPDTIVNFVKWVMQDPTYQAKKYALILWGHGSGWGSKKTTRPTKAREKPLRPSSKGFFRKAVPPVGAGRPGMGGGALVDYGSGNDLDTIELSRVLGRVNGSLKPSGRKLDLLGLDACLMSNLEVAYEIRKHVRYVVASEDLQRGEWNYKEILTTLRAEPGRSAVDLAEMIVNSCELTIGSPREGLCTRTALDLSKLDGALKALKDLAAALNAEISDGIEFVLEAQEDCCYFWYGDALQDIASFCEALTKSRVGGQVKDAALKAREKFRRGVNNLVFAIGSTNPFEYLNCGGLTVYLPYPRGETELDLPSYNTLAFAKDFPSWPEFLRAYNKTESAPPESSEASQSTPLKNGKPRK